MPRRPPPSHLLLKEGPLPPRGAPKFSLPSMPPMAFCAPALAPKAPAPAPTVAVVTSLPNTTSSPGASPLSSASSVSSKKGEGLRAPWNHSESIARDIVVGELPKPARCATMAAI